MLITYLEGAHSVSHDLFQVMNGTKEALAEEDCSELEKPEEEEDCEAEEMCAQAEWVVSDWSGCGEGKCGIISTALLHEIRLMPFSPCRPFSRDPHRPLCRRQGERLQRDRVRSGKAAKAAAGLRRRKGRTGEIDGQTNNGQILSLSVTRRKSF